MLEKEVIQNKLDARQKLASLSEEELMTLARNPEEFDKFIAGYALSINYIYVCYAYRYNDIIKKMINENMSRLDGNEELTNNVFHVLNHFDRQSKDSYALRTEFYNQFEALETASLKLDKFGLTLEDFDKKAADYFRKMTSGDFEDIKTDPMYLATVNYMAKYHPTYATFCYMNPTIQGHLSHVDKKSFEDKKEYRKFRRAANRTMNHLTKVGRKVRVEREKAKLLEK